MYSLPFFGVTGGGQNLPIPTLYEYLETLNPPTAVPTIYEYLETLTPDESIIPSIYEYFNFTSLAININNPNKASSANPVDYVFTISRSTPRSVTTTVNYQIVNVFNTLESDFVGGMFPSGNLVFASGETTKTVTATIIGGAALGKRFAFRLLNASDSDSGLITTGDQIEVSYGEVPYFFNTVLWLDASDINTITATNNLISQWRDKSGKENDLVQATGSSQPTYSNNRVSFTSSRFLQITSKQVFANTTSGSVFFVGRQPTSSNGGWGRFGNNTTATLTPNSSGNFRESFLTNTVYTLTSIPTVPWPMPNSIVSFSNNGSQLSLWRNGVQVSSTSMTYSIPGTTHQRIGGNTADFDHQEILMFPYVLSESDRRLMEGYLANKWGLTASLPAGHPYKP